MPRPIRIIILAAAVVIAAAGWKSLGGLLGRTPVPGVTHRTGDKPMTPKVVKTDKEWKESLTPEQYRVMRQCGTEPAFSGKYNNHYEKGAYVCAACGAPLFRSDTKYDHGTGWPSFAAPSAEDSVSYREDRSLLMKRTEVRCSSCGAHLGHVFNDGPAPSYEHYCINSAALDFVPDAVNNRPEEPGPNHREAKTSSKLETATFAAGCFWGVEHEFRKIKGVVGTEVGYTGGTTPNPTYAQVCTDRTGHAEAVRIRFDPAVTGYEALVRKFFELHDPTQVNRQGPDVGTQYRSVIFTHDEGQRKIALKVIAELGASETFAKPIATGVVPAGTFTRAEEYHQRYYEKQGRATCGR